MGGFHLRFIDQDNCIDLQVFQVGIEECEPGHHYGPVSRTHYLFHLVTAGKGTFITDKAGTFELEKGQGFLICPNQLTTYYADHDDPWTYYWIELDGLQVNKLFRTGGLNIHQPILTMPNETAERRAAFELQYILDQEELSTSQVLGHTYLFLNYIDQVSSPKTNKKKTTSKKQGYFDKIHEYISYHYSEDITIDQIAGEFQLNRSYLNSLFKAEFGISIQQFLIKYRLSKAIQLLSESSLSIKEISNKVGYRDQLHFSKIFKKNYGTSPKAWRQQHTNL